MKAEEFTDARVPLDRGAQLDQEERVEDDLADDELGAWPEEMDVRYYADTSLTIPGQSEPPGDCGKWGPREFCKGCGDVTLGPQRCQRRLCEECWETWRSQQSASITTRLAAARQDASGAGKRLTHTVASPAPGSIKTLTQFEKAKQEAYRLAKEKGVRGGALIPHGWRIKQEAKKAFKEIKNAGAFDGGIWKWVREHDKDWRTLTYWSPHFHILGLGADIGESAPGEDDGWVFSRVDSFPEFHISDPESYEPMYAASNYLLSHLAFETEAGKQSVRWFGELANNQFGIEEELKEWEVSVIERIVEEITGHGPDGDGKRECEEEECEGQLAPIWSASKYLADREWCDRIGENEQVLAVAFEWAIGDIRPPPGMAYPSTEQDCKEVWGHLLGKAGVEP